MVKKKAAAKPSASSEGKRTLKSSRYQSFKLTKPIKYSGTRLPSVRDLLKGNLHFLWMHKKTIGGILLIYGLVQAVLVQGALGSNFSEVKSIIDDTTNGVGAGFTLFSYMLGSIGQTSSAEASIYQSALFVIGSLAIIWALREIIAGNTIRVRDAYYKGMYPLIPFILVLLVIGLQTVPALIGAWLYGVATSTGIAVSGFDQMFWLAIFFVFALLSFYMVCSSVFALYIVTLPNMTPMSALKSARGLVLHRRWEIARKVLVFIIVLLIAAALIVLPLILLLPPIAPIVFYAGTVVAMGLMHTYLYGIYRELLRNE